MTENKVVRPSEHRPLTDIIEKGGKQPPNPPPAPVALAEPPQPPPASPADSAPPTGSE